MLIEEVRDNVSFPLCEDAKAYIRSEFFNPRHDGVMVEYEIDNLIFEVENGYYKPNDSQLSLVG